LQYQMTELKAGLEAHKLLAQTALTNMDTKIQRSAKAYELLKKFRRRMIFGSGLVRNINRFMWYWGINKLHFVLVIDYQMVYHFSF
jgi:hypothetical protein